jgi:hypothetical protein
MFEILFTYPTTLDRHRSAPLYDERTSFLLKLRSDRRCRGQLRTCACYLLQVIRVLRLRQMHDVTLRYSESKITTPVLGWLEDSVVRSDSLDFGVAESFSTCADTWIVC